jgi:uncharacterized protein YbjQ (UPF0145 family)
MQRAALVAIVSALALAPLVAGARETEHILPVKAAAESEVGKAKLFSTPFYMKGQKHPRVAKVVYETNTEQSTRGAFRSDEASCQVAFLSCIRELQRLAVEKGANAIVDVVSTTWGKQTESATQYRCIAGTFVVHVGLKAKLVKLAK